MQTLPVVDGGRFAGLLSERDIVAFRANHRDWWLAPVSAAMRAAPTTIGPDDDIATAIERLPQLPDGALPVVDRELLLGFVTATDLLDAERRAARTPELAMTATDAMTEFPIMVAPDDSLIDAAKLMVDNAIRHLPVVERGVVVGMISDRDIRDLAGDPVRLVETTGTELAALRVRDAMTQPAETVRADAPLAQVAAKLADSRIGAVPVVDEDGRPVGLVSYVDVLRALAA